MFIRTSRLFLRPVWAEDAHAIYQAVNDEAIVRNLARAPWPYRLSDAQNFCANQDNDGLPSFVIVAPTNNSVDLIGTCGLGKTDSSPELGYWIARAHWGKGYATEAASAVVTIAHTLGYGRLRAGHFLDNPASGRVLRKTGFHRTGDVRRRYSEGRGALTDCVEYELLLSDQAMAGPSNNTMIAA